MAFSETLTKHLSELGIASTPGQREALYRYYQMMVEYNEKVNLTAITDEDEAALLHMADSAALLPHLGHARSLADIGTGAGFPGMVMAILRPDLEVTLVDSLKKRVLFLESCKESLGLGNVHALHLRAEEGGRMPKLREAFDAATARAVASLPVLLEYCLPYVRVGGAFYALKGKDAQSELAASQHALATLGGGDAHCDKVKLSGLEHHIIAIKKIKNTPKAYPRKAGTPAKNPL